MLILFVAIVGLLMLKDLATRANSAKWEKDKLQEGLIQNLIHETLSIKVCK